jgi:hypothetical protein
MTMETDPSSQECPMVRNPELLREFDKEWIRGSPPDYRFNLHIVEAMLREAEHLGAFPPRDPLEGIEVDIRVARALNV